MPSGKRAMPNFTESQLKLKIPIGFPINRPRVIPSGNILVKSEKATPSKETPALANAKIGKIKKVE